MMGQQLIIAACCWRLNALRLNWGVCFQMGGEAVARWTREEVNAPLEAYLELAGS